MVWIEAIEAGDFEVEDAVEREEAHEAQQKEQKHLHISLTVYHRQCVVVAHNRSNDPGVDENAKGPGEGQRAFREYDHHRNGSCDQGKHKVQLRPHLECPVPLQIIHRRAILPSPRCAQIALDDVIRGVLTPDAVLQVESLFDVCLKQTKESLFPQYHSLRRAALAHVMTS